MKRSQKRARFVKCVGYFCTIRYVVTIIVDPWNSDGLKKNLNASSGSNFGVLLALFNATGLASLYSIDT